MLKHTTESIPLVDPTGRIALAPSSVTVAIDKGFGLGSSSPRMLASAAKRFPRAEVFNSLLPEKLRYCRWHAQNGAALHIFDHFTSSLKVQNSRVRRSRSLRVMCVMHMCCIRCMQAIVGCINQGHGQAQ